eukprot:CAMPEP_0170757594 /NCGR_PEP_ID=MMETSP0437-20130122/14609_1 /TAXON_ID=0 /ORGANISM="Sexangularia sp." /LENGTH=463 /DNA_ID=CAMNT_0011096789 /DNA_START=77 /DNA_END=1464 /DNA_ORIENTATION=-
MDSTSARVICGLLLLGSLPLCRAVSCLADAPTCTKYPQLPGAELKEIRTTSNQDQVEILSRPYEWIDPNAAQSSPETCSPIRQGDPMISYLHVPTGKLGATSAPVTSVQQPAFSTDKQLRAFVQSKTVYAYEVDGSGSTYGYSKWRQKWKYELTRLSGDIAYFDFPLANVAGIIYAERDNQYFVDLLDWTTGGFLSSQAVAWENGADPSYVAPIRRAMEVNSYSGSEYNPVGPKAVCGQTGQRCGQHECHYLVETPGSCFEMTKLPVEQTMQMLLVPIPQDESCTLPRWKMFHMSTKLESQKRLDHVLDAYREATGLIPANQEGESYSGSTPLPRTLESIRIIGVGEYDPRPNAFYSFSADGASLLVHNLDGNGFEVESTRTIELALQILSQQANESGTFPSSQTEDKKGGLPATTIVLIVVFGVCLPICCCIIISTAGAYYYRKRQKAFNDMATDNTVELSR